MEYTSRDRAAAFRTPVVERLRAHDPRSVGRFRLEARLGTGGMGQVYLGRTPEGRQAAVKVIHDDLSHDVVFRARFRREVSAALRVAGAFTAQVLDADPEADPPWLATEYVHGPSLRDAVQEGGPLSPAELKSTAAGLADAVAAIHAAGLVHRDLKPANVLLSPTGPKVIDFGIAWSSGGTRHTGDGQAVGTPEYLAPEQVTGYGPGTPAIDIFALGATLAFAATGEGPFAADTTSAVLYRITRLDPDLTGVPRELRVLVGACLDKDPHRRPTARQIVAHLRTGRPITADVDERHTRPLTLTPPPAPNPPAPDPLGPAPSNHPDTAPPNHPAPPNPPNPRTSPDPPVPTVPPGPPPPPPDLPFRAPRRGLAAAGIAVAVAAVVAAAAVVTWLTLGPPAPPSIPAPAPASNSAPGSTR